MTHRYIGTKEVTAWPALKFKTTIQGMECPVHPSQEGYAVKYEDGYISWSPKDVFEAAYRQAEGDGQALTFGDALHFIKQGRKVARAGWNGKGMWLGLHEEDGAFIRAECGTELQYADYIVMKTADNKLVPWLCSQTDALAEDWQVLA